jgi:polyphenol oxidase
MIPWDAAPEGISVRFTTRRGGVSTGAFSSLNLGALTDDDPAAVRENRRRAVESAGADASVATMAWQVAGPDVREVVDEPSSGIFLEPGREPFPKSDGLVTSLAERPMVLLTADCLPIAVARTDGSRLALLQAGWQGLLAGICERGAEAVGPGSVAIIGPGAGPCCYEVRDDVGLPLQARFGSAAVREGRADLWYAARVALERAGVERVEVVGRCTMCNPEEFFSHRRDRGRTGRQGVVGVRAA